MKTAANPGGLIPLHGGYRKLKSFRVAELVYDVTVRFFHEVHELRRNFRQRRIGHDCRGMQPPGPPTGLIGGSF
jgi:hypothetical protein